MKICFYNGYKIAVLTRGEHCPPHAHVNSPDWDARFVFSFWNGSVRLWDVEPVRNSPPLSLLENLRLTLKHPPNLRRAREAWWNSLGSVCLERQHWLASAKGVVPPSPYQPGAVLIQQATFDPQRYLTVLHLAGHSKPQELAL